MAPFQKKYEQPSRHLNAMPVQDQAQNSSAKQLHAIDDGKMPGGHPIASLSNVYLHTDIVYAIMYILYL